MSVFTTNLGYVAGNPIQAVVSAVNNRSQESADSVVSNVDILAQTAPPAAPTSFAAVSAAGDVTLTWTAYSAASEYGYSDVTDFYIEYSSSSNSLTSLRVTDQSATSFVIENLTPAGEEFTYTLKSANIHGNLNNFKYSN